MNSVFIIAEAGVNHNGSLDIAYKLIDEAKNAGADAVKFQTFKAEDLTTKDNKMAEYQITNTSKLETQLEMLKRLELSFDDFLKLKIYCDKINIEFLSSPFDIESARFLYKIGLKKFKIASGEITNIILLREIGSYKKDVIMSTGMCYIAEVENALNILIENGTEKQNICILHCNTEYPTIFEDVNLLAMTTLENTFKVDVGYSDHTEGMEVPLAAVALGAKVIEKHFTLDRSMEGPDHKASMEPEEFRKMVSSIRNIEKCLGDGVKKPSESEKKNINLVRKSIVASKVIRKGEIFSESNLTVKRPGNGLSPFLWDKIIGKIAQKDYYTDEQIDIF
ncbi:MAG: N-acetylneuraminate synthase [Exilispira sp.]|nr:N-acetylneuraminate synthase [Exilispira sp.]